jgi:hypothetical protein
VAVLAAWAVMASSSCSPHPPVNFGNYMDFDARYGKR